MRMNELIKSAFKSEVDSEFNTSTKMYNRIWDNINSNLPKEKKFNNFFSSYRKIGFLTCASIIAIISLTYLFTNHNSWIVKKDDNFISIENKSKEGISSSRKIPFYVKFNDVYYSSKGTYINDEKIRNVGKNQLEYMGDLFEIQGVPISQKVALHLGDNIYMIYENINIFDESAAMSSLLKYTSDENIKYLNFPVKSGSKEEIVDIYDMDSKTKQIPIKLENKIEKTDNNRFHITLSVSWNSKDYNVSQENDGYLEHFWEFDVTPDKIVPINQGGSQIFNLALQR